MCDVPEMGQEAIPLRRNAGVGPVITLAEAEDQQVVPANDPWPIDRTLMCCQSFGLAPEDEVRRHTGVPARIGGQVELLAEGAGERFVRSVAGIERDGQDVRGGVREPLGRFAQTPRAHV